MAESVRRNEKSKFEEDNPAYAWLPPSSNYGETSRRGKQDGYRIPSREGILTAEGGLIRKRAVIAGIGATS